MAIAGMYACVCVHTGHTNIFSHSMAAPYLSIHSRIAERETSRGHKHWFWVRTSLSLLSLSVQAKYRTGFWWVYTEWLAHGTGTAMGVPLIAVAVSVRSRPLT